MTIQEFEAYNEAKNMPQDDIGQGFGYKDADFDWYNGNERDIIYIPEYGYNSDKTVDKENAFSKQDLVELVKAYISENFPDKNLWDKEYESLALSVFEVLDWQFPSTLVYGDGILDDYFEADDD